MSESDQRATSRTVSSERETAPSVDIISQNDCLVGESLFWGAEQEEFCWVDPSSNALFRHHLNSGKTTQITLEQQLFSVRQHPTMKFVGVGTNSFYAVDIDTGACTKLAEIELDHTDCRFNDCVVDGRGRVWVGSMSTALRQTRGSVFVLLEDRSVLQKETGFGVPNGMGFSATEDTFFMVDTLARTLLAFEFDFEKGDIRHPQIVTDFWSVPGKPDGLTVAGNGNIWVAMWEGSCVVEIDPSQGAAVKQISLPVKNPTSCVVSPAHPNRIFVASSRARHSNDDLARFPLSGSLLAASTALD